MKKLLLILLTLIATTLVAQAQTVSYNGLTPAVIIDVRTPAEFASGHIPGAVNIPLDRISAGIHSIGGLSRQSRILLYCHTGRRSSLAHKRLVEQGFRNVIDGGGMTTLAEKLTVCRKQHC